MLRITFRNPEETYALWIVCLSQEVSLSSTYIKNNAPIARKPSSHVKETSFLFYNSEHRISKSADINDSVTLKYLVSYDNS